MAEEEAPQPAPSPATFNVPPGRWLVKIAKGNGQAVFPDAAVEGEGPLTVLLSVAAPE